MVRHRHLTLAVLIVMVWTAPAFTQSEKGCEGVGYTRHPRSEYTREKLRGLIERDPKDVDALVDLGLHLEDEGQLTQAYALYEKAIQAQPGCYLGYLYGGLVEQRMSGEAASDAEVKIHKALGLDPTLRDDPNVQSFLRPHAPPRRVVPSGETKPPTSVGELLAYANSFFIGVGVGLLLAGVVFSMLGFRGPASR